LKRYKGLRGLRGRWRGAFFVCARGARTPSDLRYPPDRPQVVSQGLSRAQHGTDWLPTVWQE